jgi:2OG-Fe(II) oxygenase superfamily
MKFQNLLPENNSLKDWINPIYFEKFKNNEMKEFYKIYPFEYFYVENLLKKNVFDFVRHEAEINKRQGNFSGEDGKEYSEPSGRAYSLLGSEKLLRFFLGEEFKEFLRALSEQTLVLHPKEFPQVREYPCKSSGLKIHNDVSSHFEFGTLFYLNEKWEKNWGGETKIWELDKKKRMFKECFSLLPNGNCLLGIRCSKNSWHSVDAMESPVPRQNLFFQYAIAK